MADVLSQSEIDALLSALSTGELDPEPIVAEDEKHKVKVYDFRSPQKFSKDHIRTLELIHDNFVECTYCDDAYHCKVYRCKKCGYSKKYKSH